MQGDLPAEALGNGGNGPAPAPDYHAPAPVQPPAPVYRVPVPRRLRSSGCGPEQCPRQDLGAAAGSRRSGSRHAVRSGHRPADGHPPPRKSQMPFRWHPRHRRSRARQPPSGPPASLRSTRHQSSSLAGRCWPRPWSASSARSAPWSHGSCHGKTTARPDESPAGLQRTAGFSHAVRGPVRTPR